MQSIELSVNQAVQKSGIIAEERKPRMAVAGVLVISVVCYCEVSSKP